MAETQQEAPDSPIARGFELSFTLSTFEQSIARNFKHVQDILVDHQREMNAIKQQMALQKEATLAAIREQLRTQLNFEKENSQGSYTTQTISSETQPNPHKQIATQQNSNQLQEIQPQRTQQSTATAQKENYAPLKKEIQIIEKKTFEMFQRLRSLEERELLTSRQQSINIRELEFTLMNTNKLLQKKQAEQEAINDQIQKLRNDLTGYKLKKEAKINKVLHATTLQQHANTVDSDSYEYVAEKIQFLLKHVKQLQSKKAFEEERDNLRLNIESQRKKMNEFINETYFHETIKNTELKIYNTVAKYIKAHEFQAEETKEGEGEQNQAVEENQLDAVIAEGNRELNQKVSLQQQSLKRANEKLQLLVSEVEIIRKANIKLQEELLKQNRLLEDSQSQIVGKVEELQRYVNDVKLSLNQKHLETQNQIIDVQENIEKLNSYIKSYNYAKQDISPTYSTIRGSPQKGTDRKDDDKMENSQEAEQDATAQKKKVAKLIAKVQALKADILTMREDYTRQIDGLKASLQKKAEWESLKKALNYFDEKIKEFKAIFKHLYQTTQGNQSGDSLAVKKGWTCLMCDRDIKNYEGKLGELKFTSVFAGREGSPRIGGYYKQQQSSQEYKQVFLNSRYNSKNRSSLKGNQSNKSSHSRQEQNP